MATPLTPDQMLAALRKWGVRFNEIDGWRTRGRNYVGHGAWGPVVGCMTHHTADDAPDDTDLRIVRDGRSNLPGPLAQFGGRDDGTIDLIASGRANHAGTGDPAVLAAVSAQSYGDYPPPTHYHQGSVGGADGNAHFYGLEMYYSGSHRPADVQYRAAVLLWAAICDAHRWSAKADIGHKEWSDWKSDPGYVDMRDMRADVARCLTIGPAAAAAWAYGTTSEEDDDMATPAEIAAAVWAAPMDGDTMGNRLYFAHRRAQAAVDELAKVRAELAVLTAKVDALTASPVSGTVTVTGGTLTVGT